MNYLRSCSYENSLKEISSVINEAYGGCRVGGVGFGPELERREGLHLEFVELVGGGVHLTDDHVWARLVRLAELIPDGLQSLAVSAPRSVYAQSTKSTESCRTNGRSSAVVALVANELSTCNETHQSRGKATRTASNCDWRASPRRLTSAAQHTGTGTTYTPIEHLYYVELITEYCI